MTDAKNPTDKDNTDKPQVAGDHPSPLTHIDRVQLLNDQRPAARLSDSGSSAAAAAEPTHLVMTDPFAGVRGLERIPEGTARGLERIPEGEARGLDRIPDGTARGLDRTLDGALRNLNRTDSGTQSFAPPKEFADKPIDPTKPTVLLLDHFGQRGPEVSPNGQSLSHGEFIAGSLEGSGFNVKRMEAKEVLDKSGLFDYSKNLGEIDNEIAAGRLPLGKGDAVNLSIGPSNDEHFTDFSKMLREKGGQAGLELTPQNLAANKDKVFAGLKAVVDNPASAPYEKADAERIIRTNEAIDRLQARGIKVLHAAPNDPAQLSPDFLNATELSSKRPDGQPDSFTAPLSIGAQDNGVFSIVPNNFRNLAGPGEVGGYRLGGTDLSFAQGTHYNPDGSTSLRGPLDNSGNFSRNNDIDNILRPSPLVGNDGFSKLPAEMRKAIEAHENSYPASGIAAGNSYVNISYLRQRYEEMRKEKLNQ